MIHAQGLTIIPQFSRRAGLVVVFVDLSLIAIGAAMLGYWPASLVVILYAVLGIRGVR